MKLKKQRNYELSMKSLHKLEPLITKLSPFVKSIIVIDKSRLYWNAYTNNKQFTNLKNARWITNNIYDFIIDNHKSIKDTLIIINDTQLFKNEMFINHNNELKSAFHNLETHLKMNNNFIIKL